MLRNAKKVLFVALALGLAALPAFAGNAMPNFPKAGQYVINSHPSFLISVGDSKEVVECNATLTIQAGDPYVTQQGTRRVDLKILDWKASGNSKLLGGPLNFHMTQGAKVADPSFVETYNVVNVKNGEKDFPAKAQFAVPYEIDTPFGTVSGLNGVTRGSIKAFPPSDDVFLMEKGDIAKVMAQLLPAQLSSMSAAGEVTPLDVTIRPLACACPSSSISVKQSGVVKGGSN
jgi:hypothetical protein